MRFLSHLAAITVGEEDFDIPKTPLTDSSVKTGLQIFFGIAAATAVLFIAISAFRMIISRGNAEEVKKSRDAIIYASIGLAIAMSGFTIVTFVLENI